MDFNVNKLLDDLVDDMQQAMAHLDDLLAMSYDQFFELIGDKLMCRSSGAIFCIRDFSVDYLHHLRGIGYVYGLRHRDTDVKGIFLLYSANTITLT